MAVSNVLLRRSRLVPYETAWAEQQRLLAERVADPSLPDLLWLLQHPPVYTLGKGATTEFLKFDPAEKTYELHRTERGGEVTYHCPGQLVGYPILNLHRYQPDLHWYLRELEGVIIDAIAKFNVVGERVPGLTGVWVKEQKLAAIGIRVKRWITMHGFALNVCPDLRGFEEIVPCGIGDRSVGSLAQFVPEISMETATQAVLQAFSQRFAVELVPETLDSPRFSS